MAAVKRSVIAVFVVVLVLCFTSIRTVAHADSLTVNPVPDGTYEMYDLATEFGMPGLLKAQEYLTPVIVVKNGAGTMVLATATYRYDHMALGVMEDLENGKTADIAGVPLYNDKLTGKRGTDIKGYVFVFPLSTEQLIGAADQNGTSLPYLVRYVQEYDSQYDGHWYQAEKAQLAFKIKRKSDSTALPELPADYTAVIDAISKVPDDLSIYTEESAQAVTDALAAVDTSKMASEQKSVDDMAKAINEAVAGLGIPADYTAVDAALAKIPEDLSIYTPKSAQKLFDAKAAVVRNYTTERQAAVDKMAKGLEEALSGLAELYEPIADAIRALPLPKDVKVSDKAEIIAAQTQFDALPEAQKAKVNKNLTKKLNNCGIALERALERQAAEKASKGKKDEPTADDSGRGTASTDGKRGTASTDGKRGTATGEGDKGSDEGSSDGSGEVRAGTGNQAAIAAALSGARGATGSARAASPQASSSGNDKTAATNDKADGSGKSDAADRKDAKSEGSANNEGKNAKDGKDSSADKGSGSGEVDGGADAAAKEAGGRKEAGMVASIPLVVVNLVVLGAVLFGASNAYRNRREVKVRY